MIIRLYQAQADSECNELVDFNTFKEVVEYVKKNKHRLKTDWFKGTIEYPTYTIEKEYDFWGRKPHVTNIEKKVWDDERNCERIIPVYRG